MSNELVTIQADNGSPYAIMPVLDIQHAMARRQAVIDYTRALMVVGVDFGKIPGAGDKPTLLKPGAEKLASLFGLSPLFEIVERDLDWTGDAHGGEPFFYIQYRCTLTRGELVAGQGLGSCNSWEKKYRWRQAERICPECGKNAIIRGKEEYGGGWVCFKKKEGCGYKFQINDPRITSQEVGQVKNSDPADVVNTIDKMAQKRALVAAVLIAVNASELFTQDVEDYSDIVDGEYTPQPQPPRPPAKPPAAKPAAQPPTVDPVAAFVAAAEQRQSVQAVSFANGRLTDWVNYVTGGQFNPAHAEYLNQVLDRYCGSVADNGNKHSKAAAEKARADYEAGLAALEAEAEAYRRSDEMHPNDPKMPAQDETLFQLPAVDPA